MANLPFLPDEDETSFLARRAAEERQRMEETPCIISALHEDMAETYEDRLREADEAAAAIEALALTIDAKRAAQLVPAEDATFPGVGAPAFLIARSAFRR